MKSLSTEHQKKGSHYTTTLMSMYGCYSSSGSTTREEIRANLRVSFRITISFNQESLSIAETISGHLMQTE